MFEICGWCVYFAVIISIEEWDNGQWNNLFEYIDKSYISGPHNKFNHKLRCEKYLTFTEVNTSISYVQSSQWRLSLFYLRKDQSFGGIGCEIQY